MKKAKKRQKERKSSRIYDTHHICWPKREWNRGYCSQIRSHWYFSTRIPMNTLHHRIHYELMRIPPPRGFSAKSALEQIRLLEKFGAIHNTDTFEKRLQVLIVVFECIEQPTADAFKKQLEIVSKFYGSSN